MRSKADDRWREWVLRALYRADDVLFERRFGLDVNASVDHAALESDHRDALAHATAYHAAWNRTLRAVVREAKSSRIAFANFVDLGSGKGKACLFVARTMRVASIVGVEFSAPLVAIAERNRARVGATNVHFLCADAATYAVPPGPSLIFLFNPFDDVVLRAFLATNARRLRGSGSLVAYANDVHRSAFEDAGFTVRSRDPVRRLSFFDAPL